MTFFIYSRLQHTPRASGQRVKNCHITYEYTVKKETEVSARGPSCTVYYVYFRGLPWNLSKFWGIPRSISKSWNVSKYTVYNLVPEASVTFHSVSFRYCGNWDNNSRDWVRFNDGKIIGPTTGRLFAELAVSSSAQSA